MRSRLAIIATMALAATVANAQQPLPEAPKPTKVDYALDAGLILGRSFDFVTTNSCTAHPHQCHEAELSQSLVDNRPAFFAFEAGITVSTIFAQDMLIRHGHRKLARWAILVEDLSLLATDLHNKSVTRR